MSYLVPRDADEVLAFLAKGNPKIIAGCTDYFPSLRQGESREEIVDITQVVGARGVLKTESGWRLGAATTWTDIVAASLPPAFEGLKQAAREVGSLQIQNRATVVGNICNASPAADGVPPLLTLNTMVEVASTSGNRFVRLNEFIIGVRQIALAKDEFVVALHVPEMPTKTRAAFEKLGSRQYLVISIAMVATTVTVEDGVIKDVGLAVGSCSPVARRLPEFERFLTGRKVSEVEVLAIDEDDLLSPLDPISDVRGSGEYRLDVVAELCRRVVLNAARGA